MAAFTEADRDALKQAIGLGARRVKFGSGPDARETEYRSIAEMKEALAFIEGDLAGPTQQPVRSSVVAHCRD